MKLVVARRSRLRLTATLATLVAVVASAAGCSSKAETEGTSETLNPADIEVEAHCGLEPPLASESCIPQCDMVFCGQDGCGGVCGFCKEGLGCASGHCKEVDYVCGDVGPVWACDEGMPGPAEIASPKYHDSIVDIAATLADRSTLLVSRAVAFDICQDPHEDVETGEVCSNEGSSGEVRVLAVRQNHIEEEVPFFGAEWLGGEQYGVPRNVDIALAANGRAVAAWFVLGGGDEDYLWVSFFEIGSGAIEDSEVSVANSPGAPTIALPADQFVNLFWRSFEDDSRISGAVFSAADGEQLLAPSQLDLPVLTGGSNKVSSANLDDGTAVLAWIEGEFDPVLVVQHLSSCLEPIGPKREVVHVNSEKVPPAITVVHGSGYAVGWPRIGGVAIQHFDEEGQQILESPTELYGDPLSGVRLAPLEAGVFGILWSGESEGRRKVFLGGRNAVVNEWVWGPIELGYANGDVGRFALATLDEGFAAAVWEEVVDCSSINVDCTAGDGHQSLSVLMASIVNPAGQLAAGTCNDGVCGTSESCSSCPKDCGPCE